MASTIWWEYNNIYFFSTIQQYHSQTTNQHKGLDVDSDDNKVYMIRLNPHSVDKNRNKLVPTKQQILRPRPRRKFQAVLSINWTTEDEQNAIAEHYGVLDKWTASNHKGDHVNTYYELLLLVKTKSKNDNVWISFIESLHRHAAILASLLCMKFDYSNNKIIPGSLQLDDFEKAQIPHNKNPGITPREQLDQFVRNHFEALMLKTPMLIQVYIPHIYIYNSRN